MYRLRFALHVTPSAVVGALHLAAARGQPTYAALCESVRASPVVVPDETGWKARGLGRDGWGPYRQQTQPTASAK